MAADYSIYTGLKKTFSVTDYVLFGFTLAISAGIGLFYAIKDRNKLNSETFLLGDRKLFVIPVAMSLVLTFVSALALLGVPAEVYNFTTMFWWTCLSTSFAVVIVARVFVPFFYNLHMTSIFQYLELRFNKSVRVFASILFIAQTTVYMSLVLYAPSLALNAVTSINLWASVVAVGVVVTLYTVLGGMKAVVWTDTFQAVIIAAGLLAVLIKGSVVVGGFQNAWEVADNRSRIFFNDFNPTTRHSFWSLIVGGTFLWMSMNGVNQAQVQRLNSCPTLTKANIALFINLAGLIFVLSMGCMIGIVMYAFYSDCHPPKFNNLISRTDQLLPLFVMDILGDTPGIPGVFVSCVFSGSLSTISSGLNALGAVIPHDLILPFCCKNISDKQLTVLSRITVVIFGGLCIAAAFLVSQLGSILQVVMTIFSILGGPVFGMFVLGMFFPWANAWGVFAGGITSLVLISWIGLGAFINKASTATLSPVYVHGCNWNVTTTTVITPTMNAMSFTNVSTTVEHPLSDSSSMSSDPFMPIYSMSYLYYTPVSLAVHIVIGMIISLITGKNDPARLNPRLICPLFDRLFPCLPECILKPLRFEINENKRYIVDSDTKVPLWSETRQQNTINVDPCVMEKQELEV